ncbi:hypothetical protein ACFLUV_07285, partial [Elusimicrobiota bacterium]
IMQLVEVVEKSTGIPGDLSYELQKTLFRAAYLNPPAKLRITDKLLSDKTKIEDYLRMHDLAAIRDVAYKIYYKKEEIIKPDAGISQTGRVSYRQHEQDNAFVERALKDKEDFGELVIAGHSEEAKTAADAWRKSENEKYLRMLSSAEELLAKRLKNIREFHIPVKGIGKVDILKTVIYSNKVVIEAEGRSPPRNFVSHAGVKYMSIYITKEKMDAIESDEELADLLLEETMELAAKINARKEKLDWAPQLARKIHNYMKILLERIGLLKKNNITVNNANLLMSRDYYDDMIRIERSLKGRRFKRKYDDQQIKDFIRGFIENKKYLKRQKIEYTRQKFLNRVDKIMQVVETVEKSTGIPEELSYELQKTLFREAFLNPTKIRITKKLLSNTNKLEDYLRMHDLDAVRDIAYTIYKQYPDSEVVEAVTDETGDEIVLETEKKPDLKDTKDVERKFISLDIHRPEAIELLGIYQEGPYDAKEYNERIDKVMDVVKVLESRADRKAPYNLKISILKNLLADTSEINTVDKENIKAGLEKNGITGDLQNEIMDFCEGEKPAELKGFKKLVNLIKEHKTAAGYIFIISAGALAMLFASIVPVVVLAPVAGALALTGVILIVADRDKIKPEKREGLKEIKDIEKKCVSLGIHIPDMVELLKIYQENTYTQTEFINRIDQIQELITAIGKAAEVPLPENLEIQVHESLLKDKEKDISEIVSKVAQETIEDTLLGVGLSVEIVAPYIKQIASATEKEIEITELPEAEKIMQIALGEAQKARKERWYFSARVGAVASIEGEVIGKGYNRKNNELHAEYFAVIDALRNTIDGSTIEERKKHELIHKLSKAVEISASFQDEETYKKDFARTNHLLKEVNESLDNILSKVTMYSTLESCPKCALMYKELGIKNAVFGAESRKKEHEGLKILAEAGIEVTPGVMEKISSKLLTGYFFMSKHFTRLYERLQNMGRHNAKRSEDRKRKRLKKLLISNIKLIPDISDAAITAVTEVINNSRWIISSLEKRGPPVDLSEEETIIIRLDQPYKEEQIKEILNTLYQQVKPEEIEKINEKDIIRDKLKGILQNSSNITDDLRA